MDTVELQAKAIIAAALIGSRAVEVPVLPSAGERKMDAAAVRLRELTDYVYDAITGKTATQRVIGPPLQRR